MIPAMVNIIGLSRATPLAFLTHEKSQKSRKVNVIRKSSLRIIADISMTVSGVSVSYI